MHPDASIEALANPVQTLTSSGAWRFVGHRGDAVNRQAPSENGTRAGPRFPLNWTLVQEAGHAWLGNVRPFRGLEKAINAAEASGILEISVAISGRRRPSMRVLPLCPLSPMRDLHSACYRASVERRFTASR